ncbi:MAG: S-methyl-5-thioribose-1-phosphate isomerase [Cyanobacteria bacterium SZAS LIN-2]|nr:S-methyl-5-thioribose-1-phosphate isomerase [Cyanobacteria bacterium SZAS LIN-2]
MEGQRLLLVDQRLLPGSLEYFDATAFDDLCFGIKAMVVRGAPSIGVTAAFGLALEAARQANLSVGAAEFMAAMQRSAKVLNATRPTAVNLRWGIERIMGVLERALKERSPQEAASLAFDDAQRILEEHIESNRAIGEYGNKLIPDPCRIMTHCNAGSLAACGWGTALGVIRSAHFAGKAISVFVDETRPRNQGANLTMYELTEDKIPATLVCDNMSGHIMLTKNIDCVVVGADRIALNGDTANKIGTYNLAVVANYHKVPFYIAAPISTFDATIADGSHIPIEERDEIEVVQQAGQTITVPGARAYNPAFDVTPSSLITAIITDRGVLRPPYTKSIAAALADNFAMTEIK